MPFSNYVEKHQEQLVTSVQQAEAALAQHGEGSSPGKDLDVVQVVQRSVPVGGVWPQLRSEPKQRQIRRSLESKRSEQIGIFSVF